MKILLLSTSKFSGSGKAACKLENMLKKLSIDCTHLSLLDNNNDYKNKIIYLKYRLKNKINSLISKIWGKDIKQFQSLSFFPSDISNKINNSEYDIIHLTWINEFLSIEDIGRIKKPIVWTLCDMWPIAGISHYEKDDEDSFWKFKNFLKYNFGKFDIDKWIIKRKIKSWKNNITFVSPSQWLYDCAKQSVITKKFHIKKIPWPIDRNIFCKTDKEKLRKKYNLPLQKKIILFNSFSGVYSKRKGGDLFFKALKKIQIDFEILIIGNKFNKSINLETKQKISWMGKINNDFQLAELINCADLLVLPSREDNLPQTGLEAQACGLPIVAFDTNGVKDLVDHKIDGYLAKPFKVDSLKDGIEWTINELEKSHKLSENSLKKAREKWDNFVIGEDYQKLYLRILSEKN